MTIILPIEKKNDFLQMLESNIIPAKSPRIFSPFSIIFGDKIRDKGVYGNIGENSFWIRAYNASGHETTLPGRYCQARISINKSQIIIKTKWKVQIYWPLSIALLYSLMSINMGFKFDIADIIALLCVLGGGYFIAVIIGLFFHRKEERQIKELLVFIRDSLK